jgi:hypothetical protein
MTLGAQRTVATSSFFLEPSDPFLKTIVSHTCVSKSVTTARGTSWLAVHVSRLHYELPSLPDKKDVVECSFRKKRARKKQRWLGRTPGGACRW